MDSDDVWTVGEDGHRWAARHWDGRHWTMTTAKTGTSRLLAVDSVDSDDVWAVGQGSACIGSGVPLAMHWDGTRWSRTPIPGAVPAEFGLDSVAARSSDDVWTVGESYGSLAFHWDGQRWTRESRGLQGRWYLEDVVTVAPDQVWAVGRAYRGSAASTLVVRWDGQRWVRMPSANSPEADNQLYGLEVVAPDDIWAVGTSGGRGTPLQQTLIEHWDGVHWTVVPSPSPGKQFNVLFSVSADSAGDAWAVGARSWDPLWWYEGAQLLLHWNGVEWTWVRKSG